jgi:hypothetical protein
MGRSRVNIRVQSNQSCNYAAACCPLYAERFSLPTTGPFR